MELELTKKSRNINIDYPEIVAECLNRGLVPALFLEDVNQAILRQIMNSAAVRYYLVDDAEFVQSGGVTVSKRTKRQSCSGFLCVRNDEEAITVFRRRTALEKYLKDHGYMVHTDLEIFGVDAAGNLRSSMFLPLFLLCNTDPWQLHEVVERINGALHRCHMLGNVRGYMSSDRVASVEFVQRDRWVKANLLKDVRVAATNAACSMMSQYDVVLLDDRGGKNLDNICTYLNKTNQRLYIERCVERMMQANTMDLARDQIAAARPHGATQQCSREETSASRAGIEHAGMECDLGAKSQPDAAAEHDVSMQR